MHRIVQGASVLVAFGLSSSLACGWNYTPSDNLLPEPAAEDDSGSEGPPPVETGDTGGAEDVPATYRLDCIDIQMLGDADDTVFQVATLQNTWAADVANFKLNILIDLLSEDPDAGEGEITIRSGVGGGWGDQCTEGTTDSTAFPVVYEPLVSKWEESNAQGECAQTASGSGSGTYDLAMGPEEVVYIYAEDDDGTAFNCSLEPGAPAAIPIFGMSATISMSDDRGTLAGTLTGCMAEEGALKICSCLAVCTGDVHPDCEGCPGGAVPLGLLLGGINSTPYCSDLLGEPAFDVTLEFTARRLADVPTTCG